MRVIKRIENIKNTKQLQCRKLYQERIDSILKSMNADENVVHVKTGDEGHIVVKYDIDHLHDCSVTFHKRKVDGGYYRVNQCAYICTTEEEIYTAIKEISGNPIPKNLLSGQTLSEICKTFCKAGQSAREQIIREISYLKEQTGFTGRVIFNFVRFNVQEIEGVYHEIGTTNEREVEKIMQKLARR